MKGEFKSFQEVIDIFHSNNVKYVILRNYDNLLTSQLYLNGHSDVDILCEDSFEIVKLLGAYCYEDLSPKLYNDGTHYYIYIKGNRVKLDLRHVGDGYYCTLWEKDMLQTRVLSPLGFYVPNETNMLYSILYHSLIQKKEISNDYLNEIKLCFSRFNIKLSNNIDEKKQFISVLESFMRSKGYFYSYPRDIYVPLNKKLITHSMIESNKLLKYKHMKFDYTVRINQFLVNIKHFICRSFH